VPYHLYLQPQLGEAQNGSTQLEPPWKQFSRTPVAYGRDVSEAKAVAYHAR